MIRSRYGFDPVSIRFPSKGAQGSDASPVRPSADIDDSKEGGSAKRGAFFGMESYMQFPFHSRFRLLILAAKKICHLLFDATVYAEALRIRLRQILTASSINETRIDKSSRAQAQFIYCKILLCPCQGTEGAVRHAIPHFLSTYRV